MRERKLLTLGELRAAPEIEIYLDPGNASPDTIQEVLERLSDLHRAAGGLGLEYRTDGMRVLATEEVER